MRPTLPRWETLADPLRVIIESGMLTKGHHLEAFERAVADYLGVRHAVGVSSCTTGLLLTCLCLDLHGEVLVPSFTFMATVHAMVWQQLTPVFVDVDPETWNINPAAAERAITPQTTAIVGVHVFGNPAPVEELERVAARHGLTLILDAAHGFGALHYGQPVGRYGHVEVFSSSPTKLLVTGEGGVVTTNDGALAERLRVAREYGNPGNYDSLLPGINARMQEFSAILGLETLKMLEENAQRRNALVAFMSVELMLNAANPVMVAFALARGNLDGQIATFFVMVVAAAEVVVGLSIIITIYRTRRSTSVDAASLLKL